MYLIDSDVFITAKNAYYAFDICPGFWSSLLVAKESGRVFSLDRIRQELLQGRDDDALVQWVNEQVPASFFLNTQSTEAIEVYTAIMLWVQRNPQYYDHAKARFAAGADGWLVAYAKVHGHTVVTNEQPRPGARNEIKLPDVCEQFGVRYRNTFEMLRDLRIQFE
jgi:hypothetical protein